VARPWPNPDVLSGRVDLFFDSTPSALNYIKSGQVRGIGILTAKRNPQAPDVPTMTESGARFEAVGGELMEVAPDRLSGIIKADYDRWIAIIREAGIRLE
jgi:tripartite-type tricarboxylate transporter receptor subunit TctC